MAESFVRYDDAARSEVIILENMWRDRIYACQRNSVSLGLYHKLPLCVIYHIARLAYPQARVVDLRQSYTRTRYRVLTE